MLSLGRIAGEFLVGETHVINDDMIGSNADRRLKVGHPARTTRATGGIHCAPGNEVILVDTISADAQASDEHTVLV